MNQNSFEIISALLKRQSGLIIGRDKLYLLETRLAGMLKREKLRDLNALADLLRNPANDHMAREVVEAMTTNESFFFRDDKPFLHFRNQALPKLLVARTGAAPLRVWSAAASSGQEAYSLAMIINECQAAVGSRKIEILGTDIAREQLARAKSGTYSQFEVQRGLPVQMLLKYFTRDDQQWKINDQIRSMVEFREWNLLSDSAALGKFDVIFCRNVLIYFDQSTKSRVLDFLSKQLAPDGFLYLGGAETVLGLTDKLIPMEKERGVYVRADQVVQEKMRA